MREFGGRQGAIFCARDGGFVMRSFGSEAGPENVRLASVAACVAYHMMDWLLEPGAGNTGFCVRTSGRFDGNGLRFDEIAVATDLKGMAIDDECLRRLQQYVRQRPSLALMNPGCPVSWSWRAIL